MDTRATQPHVRASLAIGIGLIAAASVFLAFQRMIDLDVYRMGAWAALHGRNPYPMRLPYGGLQYTYTPFSTLVFIPIELLPQRLARGVDAAASMLALWFVVHQLLRRLLPSDRSHLLWSAGVAITTVAFWSEPVRKTLTFGQINLLLMLLVVVDLLILQRTRFGGSLIGIAAGIKLIPVIYIAYLLVTGRTREAVRASAVATGTLVLGWIVLPTPTREYFTRYLLDTTRIGKVQTPVNQSLNGALARALHSVDAGHRAWFVAAALTLAVGLWCAARSYRAWGELAGLSITAITGLLVSPISWNHHWVWWIVPALVCARAAWDRTSTPLWVATGLWTVTFFVVPFWLIPMQHRHELHQSLFEMVRGSAYVIAGLALIGSVTAVHVRRLLGTRSDPVEVIDLRRTVDRVEQPSR